MRVGRAVVELSLFVMLPIMAVMLSLMRIGERAGFVDWVVRRVAPVVRPAGLTGLGVFAMLQVSVVSFAAPITTLLAMARRGASDRHIASTMAMVLAMGQANVLFPLAPLGLRLGHALLISLAGGLVASAATYYVLGRHLSGAETAGDAPARPQPGDTSLIAEINAAGREAVQLSLGIIPMVSLALVSVTLIREAGGFALIETMLGPVLRACHVAPGLVEPTLTKYLAGGTAVLALMLEMHRQGDLSAQLLNAGAGWFVNSIDLPGVAIFMAASPRLAKVWKPAVLGALVGIGFRAVTHGGSGF